MTNVLAAVRGWARGIDRGLLLLIPPFLAYVVAWSYLTLAKYYALTATVWDLGAGMQDMWVFTQVQTFSPLGYLEAVAGTPVHFMLAPLGYAASYPLILVFQTVALALGAFPLYVIARDLLGFRPAAYSISVAYLLYFPLAGVNWFDFHFEALFIPLFLFGYLAYLRKWTKTSLLLFVVAGSTTYPYMALIVLFAFLTLAEALLNQRIRKLVIDPWVVRFGFALLVISALYLAYQYWYWTLSFGNSYLTVGTNTSSGIGFTPSIVGPGIVVIVFILAPLVFLTCRSPKWWVMLAPIAFLILGSNYSGYHYPALLRDQYLAAAIPFVLLGAIYGLGSLRLFRDAGSPAAGPATKDDPAPRWSLLRRRTRWTVLGAMLTSTVAFSLVFQPYGPLNGMVGSSFDTGTATSIDWTAFDELTHLVGLVPGNDPSVLFQNNMPELLPRPLEFYNTPLASSILGWQNITTSEVLSNQFAVRLFEGKVVTTPLSYAVADPGSPWFIVTAPQSNFSMESASSLMYASGVYGLLGEAGGMFVLERGYSGGLEYYVPYAATFPATLLYSAVTEKPSKTPAIVGSNLINDTLWYGPYSPIVPGLYRVSVSLETSTDSVDDHFKVGLRTDFGQTLLWSVNISGKNLSATDSWQTVSFLVNVGVISNSLEIDGYDAYWNGTLSVRSISLAEVGPPR